MKRNWTEQSARSYLLSQGAEFPTEKFGFKKGGFNGLKACSAISFLRRFSIKFYMPKGATK